jgi:hypothetical protein
MSQYAPCPLTGQGEIHFAALRRSLPQSVAFLTCTTRKSYNPFVEPCDDAPARFSHRASVTRPFFWSHVYYRESRAARD